ncbi:MAG TPA: glycosyl hydrolase family 28-related protein [Caulobacteraceae bacterium]|jgi:hypothetical protein|nr:glycosyl hydrolase family 28-related protein [Caulobacteraceae bacterium]
MLKDVVIAACLIAACLAASAVAFTASSSPRHATPVTAAALPLGATIGRGASVPFDEYEAENGATNGEIIGPDRGFGALAAEASGRRAVRLNGVGGYVEIVLAHKANAVTLRYALPDSADGRGLDGAIGVWADGERLGELKLTSRYGWFYGAYPFSNNPADGRPHHFYDETRLRFARVLPAGARVRFAVDHADAAPWRVLDLADFELVGPPVRPPRGALSVLDFGADPNGAADSAVAFDRAIATGRATRRPVYIDPGDYRIDRHLVVDRVTLAGAGPWYSVLHGAGVGLYGPPPPGGARNVVLRDFAIFGDVTDRDDKAKLAGVGGAMSDTLIENLWIQHEKNGLWFDGPMRGVTARNLRILDETADGLNFDRGVSDAVVENSFVRNTGDDGLASWSHVAPNRNIVFRHNTVIAPILANGIALYGGAGALVSDNLVADTVAEGGGYHLGARFSATPFEGAITFRRNVAVRAGGTDPNWRSGVGAFWLYALDRPISGADIRVEALDLIDSTYDAILLKGGVIEGIAFADVRIDGAGTHALQVQASGIATFSDVRAQRVRDSGVAMCGSDFTVRGRGNSGWADVSCPAR